MTEMNLPWYVDFAEDVTSNFLSKFQLHIKH